MITASTVCSSFKKELLLGTHDFAADSFKIALYQVTAPLDSNTTAYLTDGEIVATGYVAGGLVLLDPQVFVDPGARAAFATFSDPVWPDSVITARGALIYNNSKQQRAVAVLDFGSDQSSNHGPFLVKFPPPGASTALIRIL